MNIAYFITIYSAKYLLFVSIAMALIYFSKQSGKKQKEILIFAAFLLPSAYLIAKISGYFFYDPRPFVVGQFTPLFPHAPDNGFPSDHTLLAAAIAAVIFRFAKKPGLFLFFLAVLVGIARVSAGIHHLIDVLGSIFIVLGIYVTLQYIFEWQTKQKK